MSAYSIAGYGGMIADRPRMEAYDAALRRAVHPGSVVIDIGTGTGIFAVLACRYGARRVYAIEPDDAIQIAQETAVANGCADRIEFVQDLSTKFSPPEQADVVVSDLRGVLPLYQHHVPSIVDARLRLLAPGGTLIPLRDTLWMAAVTAPDAYDRHVQPWGANARGVDMGPSRRLTANTWRKHRFAPEQLLLPAQPWAVLDYSSVAGPDLDGQVAWTVDRAGTGHGLAVWFDAVLAEGIGFSNAPSGPELIYGTAFFPWTDPVPLDPGDEVTVRLHADLVGEDYVWRWDTRVVARERRDCVKARFRQSLLQGVPLSLKRLKSQSSSHVPKLSEDGRIDRLVLSRMDGETALETIAAEVAARFPERFRDWREALTRVGALSQKYGSAR